MRRLVIGAALCVAVALAAVWIWGDGLTQAALEAQRAAQNRLAGVLRALRGGQPGALAALVGLAFTYGVLHAAGPGHGKLLIGGWSLGRPVSVPRVLGVSFVASMAQSAVAVALVLGLALALGWDRERLAALADGPMLRAGTAVVLLIGLWLALRGLVGLRRAGQGHDHGHTGHGHAHAHHDHDHDHGHGHGGRDHGHHHHAHLPDPATIARAVTLREQAVLVAAVAIRPCSGALILMALTVAMGIPAAGMAATFAMGLGTFATVAGAGLLAGLLRAGTLAALADHPALRVALPLLELLAGLALALASAVLLLR